jgi:ferritin-like metal-binding protein YciE
MKWLSEDFKNLHALYINQLRILLSAEEQIVRALPAMRTSANDEELRQAFEAHVEKTDGHIKRLEEILGAEKSAHTDVDNIAPAKCHAVAALVQESSDIIVDARDAWVRDAALIAAAQRIEHYEIASYGAVRQWARVLGETTAAELLDRTIKEAGHADHVLTAISERLNPMAKVA